MARLRTLNLTLPAVLAPAACEERNASRALQGVAAHRLTHRAARCVVQKSTPGANPLILGQANRLDLLEEPTSGVSAHR